jgi:sulfite exporter TauE/SafE
MIANTTQGRVVTELCNMEIAAAFMLGLFGSLHCVGMCGPLMLAAGGEKPNWQQPMAYQSGRLMTYILLGGIIGSLSLGLRLWNAQSVVAIVSGVLLLVVAALRADPGKLLLRWPAYARFQVWLRSRMQRVIGKGGLTTQFGLGACNGLVPCGLVYIAIVGAANTGSPLTGGAFMFAFGLGTMPLLLTTLYAGRRLLRVSPLTLQRWTPAILVVTAVLLIWRGYNAHMPGDFVNYQDVAFPPMCH